MKSLLFAFSAAFALVGSIAAITTGCGSGENCAPTPSRPEAQAPLPNLSVHREDQQGQPVTLPVVPENGSLEVTGDQVLIRYRQDDLDYRVEYRVSGPH